MKSKFFLLLISLPLIAEELTLDRAVELAVQRNPQLIEAAEMVKAAKARARAAGSLPNPEAVVRVENAPSDSEFLAGASQSIPLGGRLGAARELEKIRATAAELEAERVLLQVRRKVQGAFATALFADEATRIQSNTVHDAETLTSILKARVENGDALPGDLARVESEALRASVELKSARHLQEHARKILFAEIGDPNLAEPQLIGKIDDLLGLNHLALLLDEMRAAEKLGETAVQESRAALNLARKERIPDINVELLYRRVQGSDENGFDAGFSIPIPIFGRSAQKVKRASAELAAAEARFKYSRMQASVQEHEIRAHLETALEIATLIKQEIKPRARKSLEAATARYKAGDISLSEYLLNRREFLAVEEGFLRSLRSIAEIWTLTSPH